MVREEWTAEVFDGDMVGGGGGECYWDDGEMLKLLKIGMCCCEWEVGKRWGLNEAVRKIEELSFGDVSEEFYSSQGSRYGGFDSISSFNGRRKTTAEEDESSFLGS